MEVVEGTDHVVYVGFISTFLTSQLLLSTRHSAQHKPAGLSEINSLICIVYGQLIIINMLLSDFFLELLMASGNHRN